MISKLLHEYHTMKYSFAMTDTNTTVYACLYKLHHTSINKNAFEVYLYGKAIIPKLDAEEPNLTIGNLYLFAEIFDPTYQLHVI